MPSFTVASAQAIEVHPGLKFAIDGEDFVHFQSGDIYMPEHEVHVFYDSQRLSENYNPGCAPFGPSTKVTLNVKYDDSTTNKPDYIEDLVALDCLKCGQDCQFIMDYVKVGDFTTPEKCNGSDQLQIWLTGTDDMDICEDDNSGKKYTFPMYCQ
ncbi:MAG: hypothetical protein F6K26_08610 [Moorea sp. SIO2I5]|nr:hypothetical protein [Moorena sp. SIO2I5]